MQAGNGGLKMYRTQLRDLTLCSQEEMAQDVFSWSESPVLILTEDVSSPIADAVPECDIIISAVRVEAR